MTLKTPQDQQAVNARPTPQWDFAPEGALASSPQVGLGGAGPGASRVPGLIWVPGGSAGIGH